MCLEFLCITISPYGNVSEKFKRIRAQSINNDKLME